MKSKLLFVLLIAISVSVSQAQGYYLEFKMSMGNTTSGSGIMKTFYQDGNTRTEVAVSATGFNKTIVTLILKATPDKVYALNTEQKTYIESDVNKNDDADEGQESDYEITVLGKEMVNGYNTTHVKILNVKNNAEQEFWTSTEVPGYADFEKIKTKYTGKESLTKALAAKGALGFPVRIKATEKMGTFQLDLVKAAKQTNPASLFSLDGYTKQATTSASSPTSQQEIMQKLQNMSPDERQKYIQQMILQQQNQPH